MLVMRRLNDAALPDRAKRALAAIGPAALASLLLISLWPSPYRFEDAPQTAATLAGLSGVILAHRWRRNLALSVLAGTVAYAAVLTGVR